MEQHGYDVSYISDIDTHAHAHPAGLLRAKGFISVRHDECRAIEMHENVSASWSRAAGP